MAQIQWDGISKWAVEVRREAESEFDERGDGVLMSRAAVVVGSECREVSRRALLDTRVRPAPPE